MKPNSGDYYISIYYAGSIIEIGKILQTPGFTALGLSSLYAVKYPDSTTRNFFSGKRETFGQTSDFWRNCIKIKKDCIELLILLYSLNKEEKQHGSY